MIRQFSAGGVVYKKLKTNNSKLTTPFVAKVLWLVTKSNPSELVPGEIWRLPKGWLDDKAKGKQPGPLASGEKRANEEQLQQAALREVKEEGGVEAAIVSKIATFKYFINVAGGKGLKFVTYYLMEYVSDSSQGFDKVETSEIDWLGYAQAKKRLSYSREKEVLKRAKELLEKGAPRQSNLV